MAIYFASPLPRELEALFLYRYNQSGAVQPEQPKSYYFRLSDGTLSWYLNYSDAELQCSLDLTCGNVSIKNGVEIIVQTSGSSLQHVMIATNSQEAAEWQEAIESEIGRLNALALRQGSRSPEVVEWYYRRQAEVAQGASSLRGVESVMVLHCPDQEKSESSSPMSLVASLSSSLTGGSSKTVREAAGVEDYLTLGLTVRMVTPSSSSASASASFSSSPSPATNPPLSLPVGLEVPIV